MVICVIISVSYHCQNPTQLCWWEKTKLSNMWQVYWDLLSGCGRCRQVTETWMKTTCFILFAYVSIYNNMLPYGKTELSPSWQFDGCCLQQMYGVMWKPVDWGRDTYLWLAVSENPNMSFWCHNSYNSCLFFFPSGYWCLILSTKWMKSLFEEFADPLTLLFAVLCCFTGEQPDTSFWSCLLLHHSKRAIISTSWATNEFLIRCDRHSDHDNQINQALTE